MNVSDIERERPFQQEYQTVIDFISLDAETFTHLVPVYQTLAGHGNEDVERMLNLVHTTTSIQRAKNAITAMPPIVGDDIDYRTGGSEDLFGDEDDDERDSIDIGGDVGPSSRFSMPSWAFSKECDEQHFKSTLFYII